MLRAVRFSAQLDFDIEDSTLRAIGSLYNDLTYVSMERVQAEINKLLESSSPHKLALLWQTGLSRVIFPQIPDYPEAWDQVGSYQVTVSGKKAVYLAALFYLSHNFDPTDVAVEALRRLKYDNQTMTTVALLIRGLRNHHAFSERNVRRIVTELGEKIAADVLNLTALLNNNSPAFGGNQSRFALKSNQSYPALENNQNSFHLENNHNRPALESNESPSLYSNLVQFNTRPALSGQDLQHSGLCYGKEIGFMLYMLSLCLYERPELNDKKTLLTLAQMMKQKYPLS
ncbi:MAG: hypothetical protein N2376_06135 [Clostridia bacterium]|nr:hypothetical protein [Clostridia bacterium]